MAYEQKWAWQHFSKKNILVKMVLIALVEVESEPASLVPGLPGGPPEPTIFNDSAPRPIQSMQNTICW